MDKPANKILRIKRESLWVSINFMIRSIYFNYNNFCLELNISVSQNFLKILIKVY